MNYKVRRSGYTKNHPKPEKPKASAPRVVTKRKGIKPPPGISDALMALYLLKTELKTYVREPFSINIDVLVHPPEPDGTMPSPEWQLVVRGWKPPFDTWGGYPVKHRPSTIVRNTFKSV